MEVYLKCFLFALKFFFGHRFHQDDLQHYLLKCHIQRIGFL